MVSEAMLESSSRLAVVSIDGVLQHPDTKKDADTNKAFSLSSTALIQHLT